MIHRNEPVCETKTDPKRIWLMKLHWHEETTDGGEPCVLSGKKTKTMLSN